jgi:hypothetical protein
MEPKKRPTIAVYGGRADALIMGCARLTLYASGRFGGTGDAGRLCDALCAGQVAGLVLWLRFAGHSDGARLTEAARRGGVPVRVVMGGRTSLRRAVRELARGAR